MFGNIQGYEFRLKINIRDVNNDTFEYFRNQNNMSNHGIRENPDVQRLEMPFFSVSDYRTNYSPSYTLFKSFEEFILEHSRT
jgi:hypothetical protein